MHAKEFRNDAEAVAHARKQSANLHPSKKWEPMQRIENNVQGVDPFTRERKTTECWENSTYLVSVHRYPNGWMFDSTLPYVVLGICLHDGSARHDWREYQRIKNDIVGAEWDALELYPAESRLLDPSNYYYLWCAPEIPLGKFVKRTLLGPKNCLAPQRGWAPGDEPPDLREIP